MEDKRRNAHIHERARYENHRDVAREFKNHDLKSLAIEKPGRRF